MRVGGGRCNYEWKEEGFPPVETTLALNYDDGFARLSTPSGRYR